MAVAASGNGRERRIQRMCARLAAVERRRSDGRQWWATRRAHGGHTRQLTEAR